MILVDINTLKKFRAIYKSFKIKIPVYKEGAKNEEILRFETEGEFFHRLIEEFLRGKLNVKWY